MKINKNDPRLTAYLLNETSKEDRLLVEQAVRESAEIKEEIEKLKASLGLLRQDIPVDEDFFKLTNQQRQQIFAKISDSEPNFLQRFIRGPWGYVTAGLVTASFAFLVFNNSLKKEVTQNAAMTKEEIVATELQKVQEAPAMAKDKASDYALADDAKPAALSAPAASPAKPSLQPSKAVVFEKKETTPVAEDQAANTEAEMAMADSAPSESLGAASAAAPEPAPQMAEVAERKKSIGSSGAAFGGGGLAEGSTKGSVQNFQKMKAKKFADDAASSAQARAGFAGPSAEFLLQTEPQLPQALNEKLHSQFQDCLFSPDNNLTSFKLKWDGTKASDILPATALTSTQKSCLEAQLKNTLGAKKDILIIKINTVSK